MKRLVLGLAAALLVAGCNAPPRARVRNNLPAKLNASFQPASGYSINVNDVGSKTVSSYVDLPEGMVRIHVSTSSTNPADINFTSRKGQSYTVQVDTGATPTSTLIQD